MKIKSQIQKRVWDFYFEGVKRMYIYEFVGGKLNGFSAMKGMPSFSHAVAELGIRGFTNDYTDLRKQGCCCHRAELDNQPIFYGYLSPMYGGERYFENGKWKSKWDLSPDFDFKKSTMIRVIRYETWEVYDRLSR